MAIPGFAEGKKDDVPILGAIIDEDFLKSLEMRRVVRSNDVPVYSDFQLTWPESAKGERPELLRDDADKWFLSEIANAVRKIFDHEGPLSFSRLDKLITERRNHGGVVEACELLNS
jgi:hypothetical protein